MRYVIAVADHGTGISERDLQSIFEPFFSTKGDDPGTGMGLGLSISQAIMESLPRTATVAAPRTPRITSGDAVVVDPTAPSPMIASGRPSPGHGG